MKVGLPGAQFGHLKFEDLIRYTDRNKRVWKLREKYRLEIQIQAFSK